MKDFTKDDLTVKEDNIIKLLDTGDQTARYVMQLLCLHYLICDLKAKEGCRYNLLQTIYLCRDKSKKWKLANSINVSESTLRRYRHDIVNSFNICYDKSDLLTEILFGDKK